MTNYSTKDSQSNTNEVCMLILYILHHWHGFSSYSFVTKALGFIVISRNTRKSRSSFFYMSTLVVEELCRKKKKETLNCKHWFINDGYRYKETTSLLNYSSNWNIHSLKYQAFYIRKKWPRLASDIYQWQEINTPKNNK